MTAEKKSAYLWLIFYFTAILSWNAGPLEELKLHYNTLSDLLPLHHLHRNRGFV